MLNQPSILEVNPLCHDVLSFSYIVELNLLNFCLEFCIYIHFYSIFFLIMSFSVLLSGQCWLQFFQLLLRLKKTLFCPCFWKMFLLGVEFYIDFFLPFRTLNMLPHFILTHIVSEKNLLSSLRWFTCMSCVFFLWLVCKLQYFHWFCATWLWRALVPFSSCVLCLRFVELLGSVGS